MSTFAGLPVHTLHARGSKAVHEVLGEPEWHHLWGFQGQSLQPKVFPEQCPPRDCPLLCATNKSCQIFDRK